MNMLLQRLKSKTYWVALIGALLTVVEVNSGFLSTLLPVQYRQYTIMLWPVIMLALREVTTVALADKTA
jgi:uncharacterized membrane protein